MAVVVLTKDHGKILHEEAATAKWDELGFLSLFSDETDASSGIAGYAAGTWVSAAKVELTEEVGKAKPRVWESLKDVPPGTHVTDKDGGDWYVNMQGGASVYAPGNPASKIEPRDDVCAPFTEVIA
ncbi:hypothetical protein PBI_ALSFRO_58 [Mycobacterium phage Alsfro]|uniref:hypothetical protein n=1 Tax=Mycobacterium phage Alsfro TaxID=1458724 RepID=UPI00042F6021|nr:hypothetical protein PBI_ALSFRO_58 [Mycobacterium phage Alsfro]AHK12109.1 hypothetical protein PBI_ALSFRO_58 [Mycobacterium phage Alsfro]